jgi:hypothetical protein
MVPAGEPVEEHDRSDAGLIGLPVLARLPEVSPPADRARLALQLDWLKKLDWKRVRQVNLDPNWVAGGVLALVLLLLLVITLNRSPKPEVDAAAQSEAPSWNAAGKAVAPTTLSATPNIAPASPSSILPQSAISPPPASGMSGPPNQANAAPTSSYSGDPGIPSQAPSSSQGQFSLEGIFYPVTPYAAPVAVAAQPPIDHTAGQPNGSVYGRELRTAQRDLTVPHHPQEQTGSPQNGRAHLQGIISQP